jgi:hypothetical protein
MAAKSNVQDVAEHTQAAPLTLMSVMAPAAGWLVPGLGHFIQKRWIRGLLLKVVLPVTGAAMAGAAGLLLVFKVAYALDNPLSKPDLAPMATTL